MDKNQLTKLNHSLRYDNLQEEEEDLDCYGLYMTLEDYCYRRCPVCENDYLQHEWEPLCLEGKGYVEYVYCPSCWSKVKHFGGYILYNGVGKIWNVKPYKK